MLSVSVMSRGAMSGVAMVIITWTWRHIGKDSCKIQLPTDAEVYLQIYAKYNLKVFGVSMQCCSVMGGLGQRET